MIIRGKVNDANEPIIPRDLNFLIDTGFSGTLWMPKKHLKSAKFPLISIEKFEMANGNETDCKVYFGKIEWFEKELEIDIIAHRGDSFLLGTELLKNCELNINYKSKK